MGRAPIHAGAGAPKPVELLHGGDHVDDVLDHVNGADLIEGRISERIWHAVQFAQDIGARSRISIDSNGSRILVDPAPHVQHAHLTILVARLLSRLIAHNLR